MMRPDIDFLVSSIESSFEVAQVRIAVRPNGQYELRSKIDFEKSKEDLQNLELSDLRDWINTTESNQFSPLKSAPNLKPGWVFLAKDPLELAEALEIIYPGYVSDYYKFSTQGDSVAQDYPDYTSRQTGMYRSTSALDSEDIADMVHGCCDAKFCLKSRQWQWANGGFKDEMGSPSNIPCLEPCAVLLELARIQAKSKLSDQISISFSDRELDVIEGALKAHSEKLPNGMREGDVFKVNHPKRIQIIMEKLKRIKANKT